MKNLKLRRDVGVQYLSYSVDIGVFTDACKELLNEISGPENISGGG